MKELEEPSSKQSMRGGMGVVLIWLLVTNLLSIKQSEELESKRNGTEEKRQEEEERLVGIIKDPGEERVDALSQTSKNAWNGSTQSSSCAEE